MVSVPNNIYQKVKPFVSCPDPLWECVVQYESNFNPMAIGDGPQYGGYSYGLFQLHIADNGSGGQGNTALGLIKQRVNLTGQAAITYLLQHPELQAEVGMVAINSAWNHLKNSYDPNSTQWWTQFCAMSGHPGGGPNDPVTVRYVQNFMRSLVSTNAFGIQQVQPGAGAGTNNSNVSDKTWLQALINLPPHQPCGVIWRRTCPGAKNADEGGMDLPSPPGTKVYALAAGTVIGAGYFWHANGNYGYGVVTVRSALPDGTMADIYYQHLQLNPNIILCNQKGGQLYNGVVGPKPQGQAINAGQYLGSIVAAVGEVEVGINAQWGGIWGDTHPGAWVDDPEDIIRSLIDLGGGSSATSFPITLNDPGYNAYLQTAFEQAHTSLQTISQNPGLAGPIQAFDNALKFKPFAVPGDNSSAKDWPVVGGIVSSASYPSRLALGVIMFITNNAFAFLLRGFFVILAFVIVTALIINAVSHTTEEVISDNPGVKDLTGGDSGQSGGGGGAQSAMKIAELAAL